MSDASNENEMEAPATRGQVHELRGELHAVRDELHAVRGELHAVRDELRDELRGEIRGVRGELHTVRDDLRAAMEDLRADLAHQIRSMHEAIISQVAALFDPHRDLPRRMTDAEERLDALEQRPAPRRARRRS